MQNTATAEVSASSPVSSDTSASETRAVVLLTEGAIRQVKSVMAQQKLEGAYLTVRVVPAGCSGLGYDLNLMNETKPGDILWEQDGVKLCTDAISTQYLSGTEMDWVVTDTSAGFKFSNPNAKSSCGCGTSFSA
jgi:iron-sulfur cluster assembly protein